MKTKTAIIIICMLMMVILIFVSFKINEINNESERLRSVIDDKDMRISSLVADLKNFNETINKQKEELENATSMINGLNKIISKNYFVLRSYSELFFSDLTPPISKLDAVLIALDYGNWTYEQLDGARVTSTLKWARFTRQYNQTFVWVSIDNVTEPKTDYSPSYGEGEVFRYVWQVTFGGWVNNSYEDVEYWVDASSGEVFVTPVYYPPD